MRYFIEAIRDKYFTFTGRATRKEFWYFVLFWFLVPVLILSALSSIAFIFGFDTETLPLMAYEIIIILLILPSLAIASRRLHDINYTGWWQLLIFLPITGWIWLIILFCKKTVDTDNRFENNPKDNISYYMRLIRKAFTRNYINFSGRASRAELLASYYVFYAVLYCVSLPIKICG